MTQTTPPRHNPPHHPQHHTAADPANVPREEYVDNDEKALPSDNRSSLFLSIASAILGVLGLVLAFVLDWDLVGFIITLLGVIAGAIAVFAAYGDARASVVTPSIVTAIVTIVSIVVLMDLLDAEDNATTPAEAIVPEATEVESGPRGETVADPALDPL